MQEEIRLPDPAKLLKKVLAEAQFANTDIGGAVFSLLDSLSYDINSQGWDWSDATEDLMQEVYNILAKDYDDLRTDLADEDEDDEVVEDIALPEDVELEEEDDVEVDAAIVIAAKEVEEPEEIDDVEDLPDLSDLEEIPNEGERSQNVPATG